MTMPQGRTPDFSLASKQLAQRLFAIAAAGATGDAELVTAAERACLDAAEALTRWFGPYGSLALLTRAFGAAQSEHPALSEVSVVTSADSKTPSLSGLAASARTHGAGATSEGVIVIITALADLLGRLIGDDLAASLLEQSVIARGSTSSNGADPKSSAAHSSVKDQ